jgi:hypothetical protein
MRPQVGISAMGVLRPDLMMKCIVPVVMAGIIAVSGASARMRRRVAKSSLVDLYAYSRCLLSDRTKLTTAGQTVSSYPSSSLVQVSQLQLPKKGFC